MPFVSGVDLLTLSKKIKDIVFCISSTTSSSSSSSLAIPSPQYLISQPDFKFYLCSKEHCIKFVDLFSSTSLMELLQVDDENVRQNLSTLLNGTTDLIPNQYEGGFKVWEGLYDLIDYIANNNQVLNKLVSDLSVNSQQEFVNILDVRLIRSFNFKMIIIINNIIYFQLGCGSGLLSIFIVARMRRFHPSIKFHIYLQDYNDNVIKYFTIPNVIMNDILLPMVAMSGSEAENEPMIRLVDLMHSTYHFMYGDWKQITGELVTQQLKFDLVVSAETLYSEDNYEKLYNLFQSVLRYPTGQVLIATKSHYFGVGGSARTFLYYIQQQKESATTTPTTTTISQQQTKRIKLDNNSVPNINNYDAASQMGRRSGDAVTRDAHLDGDIVHDIEDHLLRHIILLNWA